MYKKEEVKENLLNVMLNIEDIYEENIPINNFNEKDLFELHKTLMKLREGVNYSKEIES